MVGAHDGGGGRAAAGRARDWSRGALREPDGNGGGGGGFAALAVHTRFVVTAVAVARLERDSGQGRVRECGAACELVGGIREPRHRRR